VSENQQEKPKTCATCPKEIEGRLIAIEKEIGEVGKVLTALRKELREIRKLTENR